MGKAKASESKDGDVEMIFGIDAKKLDVVVINDAIEKLKIKLKKSAKLPEKVEALKAAFAKYKPNDVGKCDTCEGVSPLEGFDVCPFCGVGEDGEKATAEAAPVSEEVAAAPITETRALAVVTDTSELAKSIEDLLPAPELDAAVAEIRSYDRAAAKSVWQIACKLADIGVKEMWKARRRTDGTVAYVKIEDFARNELGIDRKYAQMLQRIAVRYTEQDVLTIGPTKLNVIASIDDKELQQEALDQLRKDPTIPRREIERVAGRGGKDTKVKKKKAKLKVTHSKPAKATPTNEIEVAFILGSQKIHLKKRQASKAAPLVNARRLADEPFGHMDLANDVRMFFSVGANTTGDLILHIHTKRVTPV